MKDLTNENRHGFSDAVQADSLERLMQGKLETELEAEQEAELERELECELAESEAWQCFGKILSEAHRVVYTVPDCAPRLSPQRSSTLAVGSASAGSRRWFSVVASCCAGIFILITGLGIFCVQKYHFGLDSVTEVETAVLSVEPSDVDLEAESEDDFDWDAGDSELAMMDQLVEQAAQDDGSVDFEIAILENSLGEWSESEEENWF